jgi:hypothetical protein
MWVGVSVLGHLKFGCPRKWFFDFRRNTEFFEQAGIPPSAFNCEILRNSAKFLAFSFPEFLIYVMVLYSFPLVLKTKQNYRKLYCLVNISLGCSWTCLHKVLSCTWMCVHQRGLYCTWTCLRHRGLS